MNETYAPVMEAKLIRAGFEVERKPAAEIDSFLLKDWLVYVSQLAEEVME